MNVINWIKEKYHDNDLTESKIQDILYFGLIWNIFEKECYKGNDPIQQIIIKTSSIDNGDLNKCWNHFYNRYVTNNVLNESFNNFDFGQRVSDKLFIQSNILKSDITKSEKMKIILLIIRRLRNNLYHGYKDVHNLNSQNINFKISNEFLSKIIDFYI